MGKGPSPSQRGGGPAPVQTQWQAEGRARACSGMWSVLCAPLWWGLQGLEVSSKSSKEDCGRWKWWKAVPLRGAACGRVQGSRCRGVLRAVERPEGAGDRVEVVLGCPQRPGEGWTSPAPSVSCSFMPPCPCACCVFPLPETPFSRLCLANSYSSLTIQLRTAFTVRQKGKEVPGAVPGVSTHVLVFTPRCDPARALVTGEGLSPFCK